MKTVAESCRAVIEVRSPLRSLQGRETLLNQEVPENIVYGVSSFKVLKSVDRDRLTKQKAKVCVLDALSKLVSDKESSGVLKGIERDFDRMFYRCVVHQTTLLRACPSDTCER